MATAQMPNTHELIGALLGVRSMRGVIPDMEIVENYQGAQAVHSGKVELFFRETMFAKYNVLKTARTQLDALGVAYAHDPHAPFCGGGGQIFIEPTAYATLVTLAESNTSGIQMRSSLDVPLDASKRTADEDGPLDGRRQE